MNTQQVRMINLPIKGDLLWIYACSFIIAILMAVVSIIGLRYRNLIYPTDDLIRTFVSNDVVNLFVGLPILLGSMSVAWRGKLIGLLWWVGALFFVFYNYVAYVFAMPPNETVEKPLVRKMFIKISHNRLKNCQNVVRNTKNQALFSVSLPLFKNYF